MVKERMQDNTLSIENSEDQLKKVGFRQDWKVNPKLVMKNGRDLDEETVFAQEEATLINSYFNSLKPGENDEIKSSPVKMKNQTSEKLVEKS